ncbi:hypothetical protein Tco_0052285 [Tanacetum coccineum]
MLTRVAYVALAYLIRRDECEDFDVDKAQEETKKKSKQDSLKTPPGSPPSPPPPPPPPSGASGASGTTRSLRLCSSFLLLSFISSTHQGGQSTSTAALSSSKTAASAEYSAWTTTDTRIKPSITTIPDDLYMDDETTVDEQAYSSGEEVGRDHIPTVNLRQNLPLIPTNNWASALKTTYVPPPENSLLAQTGDIATFMDWYCKRQGISELTPKDLEGPAYEIVKVFHPDVVHLQFQMEECHKLLTDKVDDAILNILSIGRKIGQTNLIYSQDEAAFFQCLGGLRAIGYLISSGMTRSASRIRCDINEALDTGQKSSESQDKSRDDQDFGRRKACRSKVFMFAIQKCINHKYLGNLESFVGGWIREAIGDFLLRGINLITRSSPHGYGRLNPTRIRANGQKPYSPQALLLCFLQDKQKMEMEIPHSVESITTHAHN